MKAVSLASRRTSLDTRHLHGRTESGNLASNCCKMQSSSLTILRKKEAVAAARARVEGKTRYDKSAAGDSTSRCPNANERRFGHQAPSPAPRACQLGAGYQQSAVLIVLLLGSSTPAWFQAVLATDRRPRGQRISSLCPALAAWPSAEVPVLSGRRRLADRSSCKQRPSVQRSQNGTGPKRVGAPAPV